MALLAPYPSTQTRKSLSPSQAASLYETVAVCLRQTLDLPPSKQEVPASSTFISSYARDAAQQVLNSLIWDTEISASAKEYLIRKYTLQLAENLATSTSLAKQGAGIDVQILLSLSVAFARTHTKQLRSIAQKAVQNNPQVIQTVERELVPSFTLLLSGDQSSPSQGLYAIRKTAHSLLSFLRISPPELVRPFANNKEFIMALANMYDNGLASVAMAYGGLNVLRSAIPADPQSLSSIRQPDDWERIWISTKVAFVDAFHTILTCILDDLAASSGRQLGIASERAFDIMFSLVELSSSSTSEQIPPTPFLNLPLLTDYQRAYDLSRTLATSLRHAEEKDPRLDLLESTLQSLDEPSVGAGEGGTPKDAGALKILLRSSGLPQSMRYASTNTTRDNRTQKVPPARAVDKGKTKAAASDDMRSGSDPDIDIKISQVLDIFPSHSPTYIRLLLLLPTYSGNAEKVIEGLLEGTAPGEDELAAADATKVDTGPNWLPTSINENEIERMVGERKNIFDNDVMDLSKLRYGKKMDDAESLLRDNAYIEQMKADILHRAEAIELEDLDEEDDYYYVPDTATSTSVQSGKAKAKASNRADIQNVEDELDGLMHIKVNGDGESDDEGGDGEVEEEEKLKAPETILELAYIRDPKLFERDAATRRSKARAELKAQTGWGDEQIEGWRIMLERNPKKDKILQKHEFSGNQNLLSMRDSTPSSNNDRGGGSDRARGRGSNRGRGRGGRGRGKGAAEHDAGPKDGEGSARARAWKDKHKASRANHNRKRGHDRKMAKAGPGPSTA
ncbi:hypothetical protein AX17_001690 [Amanita inopinata Kibby_2008]|nr:hypothetical protein AX17_001690 [Amanita inopinata Kibby_2008]